MWKFTELRELYKKGGWKESHFVIRPQMNSKNSTYSVNSNTIERPIASQQADRSSSNRNLRAINPTIPQTMVQVSRSTNQISIVKYLFKILIPGDIELTKRQSTNSRRLPTLLLEA